MAVAILNKRTHPIDTASMTFLTSDDTSQTKGKATWKTEPSVVEVILLVTLCAAVLDGLASILRGWRNVALSFGDNLAYLQVATAIRQWDFHGLGLQQFMGYPYAIAAVSVVFHLP